MERLRQESLGTAGAGNNQFILVGEFVHTEDGDDVLQLVIFLQQLLHGLGRVVVVFTYDIGIEEYARWI